MSHFASRTPIRLRGKTQEVVGRLDTGLHHGEFVSAIHLEEHLHGFLERRVVNRSVGCVVLLLLFGVTFNYSTRLPVPIDITNLVLVVMFLAGFLGIVRLAAAHLCVSPAYFQLHRRIALRGDHLLLQREGFDNELVPMADCYLQMGTFTWAQELEFWACPEPVVLLVRPRCDRRMPESATPLCPLSVLRAEFAANPQGGPFSKLQIHERLEHDPNWIERFVTRTRSPRIPSRLDEVLVALASIAAASGTLMLRTLIQPLPMFAPRTSDLMLRDPMEPVEWCLAAAAMLVAWVGFWMLFFWFSAAMYRSADRFELRTEGRLGQWMRNLIVLLTLGGWNSFLYGSVAAGTPGITIGIALTIVYAVGLSGICIQKAEADERRYAEFLDALAGSAGDTDRTWQ